MRDRVGTVDVHRYDGETIESRRPLLPGRGQRIGCVDGDKHAAPAIDETDQQSWRADDDERPGSGR